MQGEFCMAEKDSNKKTSTKSTAKKTSASTAEKPAKSTAKNTTAAKPVKPASPAAKPAAKEKTATSVKPAPKKKAASAPKKTPKTTAVKQEKTVKVKKEKSEAKSGGAIALLNKNKRLAIICSAVAFILIIAIVIGIVAGVKSCSPIDGPDSSNTPPIVSEEPPQITNTANKINFSDKPISKDTVLLNPVDPDDPALNNAYHYEYANTTAVGYYASVTDTYERVKPVAETKNEGSAFDSEATGTVFANGAKRYPTYGSTMKNVIGSDEAQVAARQALIQESAYLCAWGTAGANRGGEQTPDKYTKIDTNGYLYQYKNNEWIHSLAWGKTAGENSEENWRQLYKHTTANGMYLEGYTKNGITYGVYDDAKRVVKEVTMRPRGYSSYGVTGLYAPAGEVIKVELSGKDMNATGGITVHIGQALYNGQANNIWASKNQMQRAPLILTTLVLNKSTCDYNKETDTWTGYVGSFVGGPIYIRNSGVKFTATISGGLEYLHFILGYTTQSEFTRLKEESKVPYFDLEVWNYGVLHSGPRYYAEGFSYDNLYKAAVLWEKVSSVTTTGSNQGIVFLYDPFVAAGAAVAFPGRSSVNCPLGWMSQSLNYNTLVTSGSWGNFHEYHHNFQNYGLGSGADGETTNNGLNLVSYALFTKISSKRGIGSYGSQGLGGWNNYTSGSWTLQRVKAGQITSTNGLAVYATLLHNFGADAYIRARGARGANNYFNKWATNTHHDFTYYAQLTNAYYNGGSNAYTPSDAVKNANYPMFVPVSCVYQTGRSYLYDGEKKYFKTMQPYVIANKPFDIDLRPYYAPDGQYSYGSIVIPDGFTYRVKSVTQPLNGSLEITDDFHLRYTPVAGAKTGSTSGQIVVTLEIVKDDGTFAVEETDLVLEFEISQEVNKMTLERTTYTYEENNMYPDAVAAYNAGFAGSTNGGLKQDQFNPTQNANTDIWFRPDTEKAHADYPNEPDKYFIHDNNIEVIDGKLYFDGDGTYRVYLRGRNNCALYYSLNGTSYTLGARITESTPVTNNKTYLFRNSAETYFDIKFDEGKVYVKDGAADSFPTNPVYTIPPVRNGEVENWLYIKEVLIVKKSASSFIGVGMRQWTDPMFTQGIRYYRDAACTDQVSTADYNNMSDEEKEALYSKIYYLNSAGQEVAEEVVLSAQSTPPTVTEKSQPYVNAYRSNYDFPNNSTFESEYFYTRSYNYSYTGNPVVYSTWDEGVSIVNCNKKGSWDDNTTTLDNILKEGQDTFFHSAKGQGYVAAPMVLELDMGKSISVNRITFLGRKDGDKYAASTAQQALPNVFKLEVSTDGVSYTDAGEYTNSKVQNDYSVAVTLNRTYEFRFVKVTIKSTHSNGNYFILSGITFTYQFSLTGNGANHISASHENLIFTDSANGKGSWKTEVAASTFGRITVGNAGDVVRFDFTGTRLAVLTPVHYDNNFKVYIDGVKVESIDVVPLTDLYGITYISQKFTSGKHRVEIRCTGETAFDSFAFYNEG